MKAAVVGSGYMDLVSGACHAKMGRSVTCVDNHAQKISNLNKGNIPIHEDPRMGHAFTFPGCGYGGSCFPKDVKTLIHMARLQRIEPKMLGWELQVLLVEGLEKTVEYFRQLIGEAQGAKPALTPRAPKAKAPAHPHLQRDALM